MCSYEIADSTESTQTSREIPSIAAAMRVCGQGATEFVGVRFDGILILSRACCKYRPPILAGAAAEPSAQHGHVSGPSLIPPSITSHGGSNALLGNIKNRC